jgi:DNA-directed RNA polymerase specialized sigma24 family protein
VVNDAEALCHAEGDGLRRALAVAFGDPALARRATVAAFAAADRRWRVVATFAEPMAWIDVAAVRHARRALARSERRRRPSDGGGVDGLAPVARTAVVLRALRGRSIDDIAAALDRPPDAVVATLREAYASLGVADPGLEEADGPYAT